MDVRRYRFGPFVLDVPGRVLECDGAAVALQPKAFHLLAYLVRERDRVVSRDELLSELWPDVAVSEASLSKALRSVRRALGERADGAGCIRGMRGHGVRFVVPVTEEVDHTAVAARLPGGTPSLVGRDDVLSGIEDALGAAAHGSGRLVLVAGVAGIGKTSVALAAAGGAQAGGARVAVGWCAEGDGSPELWPWLQMVRALPVEHPRVLDAGTAALAAFPAADGSPAPPGGRDVLAPAHARYRRFQSIVDVLSAGAADRGLMLVLDDAHWADRASLALLDYVARELPRLPAVVLVTYRPEEIDAVHPLHAIARGPAAALHELGGLGPAEVERLMSLEVGGPVPAAAAARVHAQTGGNPFFVKELLRAAGMDEPVLAPSALPAPSIVPLSAGVRAVLRRRVERLSPAACELATVCALVGREVEVGLAAAIVDAPTDAVLDLLDEATAAGVLERGEGTWRFPHDLVREALLDPLGSAARARLHWRIGEAMEAHHRTDPEHRLGAIAHHLCAGAAAGAPDRAAHYARRAGDRAARLLAYDEAALHYERALAALALLPFRDDYVQCDLLLALGEAQMFAGRALEGRATLQRAADGARRLRLPAHLARAALAAGGVELSPEAGPYEPEVITLLEEALAALPRAERVLRIRVLIRLALGLVWSSRPERSGPLMARAMRMARRFGDPVALGYALYCRHWSFAGPPDLDMQLAGAEEMLQVARRAEHRELELAAHSCRFLARLEQGRQRDAVRALARYERLAGELGVPRYRWRAYFYRTNLAILDGRLAEAEARALRTISEGEGFGAADAALTGGTQLLIIWREQDRIAEVEGAVHEFAARHPGAFAWPVLLALLDAETGRVDAARRALASLRDEEVVATAAPYLRATAWVYLAEACALVGDRARAARLAPILAAYQPRMVIAGAGVASLGSLDLYLGRLAATAGRSREAQGFFEGALAANVEAGARPWAAWSEYELARVLTARPGRAARARARDLVGRAGASAEAFGMRRLATRAGALRATLG